MSIADVTSRIGQIQAQLAMLAPRSATSGTSFSSTLDGVAETAATGAITTGATGDTTKGDAVVAEAKRYLGVPYVWGGTDPATGLDCSGLIQKTYANLGYEIPRVSYEQAKAGRPVASLADAQPGDILAFGSPVHHVGIYVGENQMIEAPRPGLDVRLGPIYETPTAIRRIVPDASSSPSRGSAGSAPPPAGWPRARRTPRSSSPLPRSTA